LTALVTQYPAPIVLKFTPSPSNGMTIPNWITFSRLLGIPLLFIILHTPSNERRWASLAIFLIVAGTDWLDGFLARRLDQVTDLGKFLDPLVDKLLVFTPLLILVEWQQLPAWGVFMIIARELTVAGWRVNQVQVSGANLWGKAKTVTQIGAIALLISPHPESWNAWVMGVFWVSVALTAISGAIYLWPKNNANIDNANIDNVG
jgi:CDP-diacylglycerol--glycerol-3-phosphate 3-phosphatidyltransferase